MPAREELQRPEEAPVVPVVRTKASRTPFPAPLPDLADASIHRKSAEQLLRAQEYARRFDMSPERVQVLLEKIGLSAEIKSVLASGIEMHRQTDAFRVVIEECPAGRRLMTASYPEDSSPPKEAYELLGTALFYTSLLTDEGALAQELCRFLNGKPGLEGITSAEFHKRVEIALLEKSEDGLSFIPALLQAEYADQNKLEQTAFLRGLLAPYFESADAARPGGILMRSLLNLFDVFHIPPQQFEDLEDRKLTRHEVRVLQALTLEGREVENPEHNISRMVNPKLRWALDELEGIESLSAVQEYLRSAREISVPELGYLLRKMPRGMDWGKKGGTEADAFIEAMGQSGQDTAGYGGFLGLDVVLIYNAICLCNGSGDSSEASKLGPELRNIVESSRTSSTDTGSFRSHLSDFLENKLTKVLVLIMDQKSFAHRR